MLFVRVSLSVSGGVMRKAGNKEKVAPGKSETYEASDTSTRRTLTDFEPATVRRVDFRVVPEQKRQTK